MGANRRDGQNEQLSINNEQWKNNETGANRRDERTDGEQDEESSLFIIHCSLFILIGCPEPFNARDTALAGKGSFSLTLSGADRTVLPTTPALSDFAVYNLAFTPAPSGTAASADRTNTTLAEPILLEPGTYNLTVSAYKDDAKAQLMARGTLNGIVINAGLNTAADVKLEALISGGEGTFRWNITLPSGVTATMKIEPISAGGTAVQTVTLSTAAGSRTLASGQYSLTFNLNRTTDLKTVEWKEIVHVYQNLESVFPFTFTDAHLSDSSYNVTFNYNYTGSTNGTQSVLHGAALTKPTDPTRAGYTFDGWYRDEVLVALYDFSTFVIESFTLNAGWTINQYAVTFNADSGTPAPVQQNIDYGGTVTQPAAMTKTGYTFVGWFKEAALTNQWNFTTDTVTAATTLYAKWNINQYAVTFSADGGTPAPTQQTVNHGGTVTQPAAMTRTGYTFIGWYKETGLTTQWNFTTDTVTAATTLYAKWNINQYTVTFSPDGGTPAPAQQTVNYGSTIAAPTDPTKAGYGFGGWYKEAGLANPWNFTTDTVTGATTLYARWYTSASVPPGANLAAKLLWLESNAQSGNEYTLVVSEDEDIAPHTLTYSGMTNITVTLIGIGTNRVIGLLSVGSMFTVPSGVTLVLDNNITLRGLSGNTAALVRVNAGGTLLMKMGASVTGNIASAGNGGGVYVNGASSFFTMSGGTIFGNTANTYGGGVYLGNNTSFTMSGGEISGNTASSSGGGGVYMVGANATFTMSGGAISGNTCPSGNGGGVFVNTNATFTMNGGRISGNTVSYSDTSGSGGGVNVSGGSSFTMSGGEISDNQCRYGGGVNVTGANSSFTMSGGKISGNTASYSDTSGSGGGVYLSNDLSFTMSGGEISGNTASSRGGGVYMNRYATFTKTGNSTITGYANDTANGNAVKNPSSGAILNDRGHAAYASYGTEVVKFKETTAGPNADMEWVGTTDSITFSGWDD